MDKHADSLGAFVNEAYALTNKQDLQQFYRKWATEYDAQMQAEGYRSPQDLARLLDQHLTIDHASVIDIGCGTGMTGNALNRDKIATLDGLDLSPEMLEVARSRQIYRQLYVADLEQTLPLADASYDAAISTGTFTHGHVGAEAIAEILRIIKPGGLLACTVHFKLWQTRGFEQCFAELISQNQITCLLLEEGQYFEQGDNEGWFCLYQKQCTKS